METKDLLYRMAEIKTTIKALTAEYDEHKDDLISAIEATNPEARKVDVGDYGRFSLSMAKVWEYSDRVKLAEEAVKSIKSEEEATGVATYTEVPRVTFTTKKDE